MVFCDFSRIYDGSIGRHGRKWRRFGVPDVGQQCRASHRNLQGLAFDLEQWMRLAGGSAKRAFVRVDGKAPIADQVSDLTSGKILNPIDLDESGNDIREAENSDVWTGSTNAGTLSPYGNCNDWTSISGGELARAFGHFDGGPAQWSDDNEAFGCNDNEQLHLYCFDTSHAEQLTYTPVSGRVAFVSKTDLDPSSGIAMADKDLL